MNGASLSAELFLLEKLGQLKNPVTLAGIEPITLRLVA
jgi:hypothetical protein